MLAENKVHYMLTLLQEKLSIWFDTHGDHLCVDFLGVDVRKLPKVELTDQIYRHERKDSSTDKIIRVTWFLIQRNNKYEVTGRFLKKVKRCEL